MMHFDNERDQQALLLLTPEHAQAAVEHAQTLEEAARVMLHRTGSYGVVWQRYGALSNLLNAARKIDRLMESWWQGEGAPALHKDNLDDAVDAINYLAFFIQCARSGNLAGDRPVRPADVPGEEYWRADGGVICECGKEYRDHPRERRFTEMGEEAWLVRVCDGGLRKL